MPNAQDRNLVRRIADSPFLFMGILLFIFALGFLFFAVDAFYKGNEEIMQYLMRLVIGLLMVACLFVLVGWTLNRLMNKNTNKEGENKSDE